MATAEGNQATDPGKSKCARSGNDFDAPVVNAAVGVVIAVARVAEAEVKLHDAACCEEVRIAY